MIVEEATGLVPPRPNLGPEPWRDPSSKFWLPMILATAAIVVFLAAGFWLRRKRSRGRRSRVTGLVNDPAQAGPRGQLVGLSESVRDALTTRFGNSVRAKTTEELADDPHLAEALDVESFEDLIRFLDRIDRIKFATGSALNVDEELARELAEWEPRINDLTARVKNGPRFRPSPTTVHNGRLR